MKRKRPLSRDGKTLRSSRLVVIASEDTHAVQQYFDFFRAKRVQFKVLSTAGGNSSPKDVLARLVQFKREFDLNETDDQLWLVTDSDHWINPGHIANLTRVVQECKSHNIQVAMSCPCFDLWLLLHFADAPDPNVKHSCDDIGGMIRAEVGSYNKTKVFNLPIKMTCVGNAIQRAKAMDPQGPILTSCGTEVFKIIEELVESKIIQIE